MTRDGLQCHSKEREREREIIVNKIKWKKSKEEI
jgi:hypothetical protein